MMDTRLKLAKSLAETEPDEALRICNDILNEDFEGMHGQMALFMSGYIMMQAERYGLAYNIYRRCQQLNPNISEIYSNMGMCLEDYDAAMAVDCFDKAYQLDSKNHRALANKALIMLHSAKPKECIRLCNEALRLDPDLKAAIHNRALANIMLRNWRHGWQGYADTLGVKHREMLDYGLPLWDGKSQGKILIYGEQGVGDEIMFASCLPDLMRNHEVVLDTDSRLKGLFSRTFDCPVYGTRFQSESPILAEHECDYQFPIGNLPSVYRNSPESFPGTPYLEVDPERAIQWSALFDTFKGKKVGLAWRGGLPSTGMKKRSLDISDLEPIFSPDNTYISLEYKHVEQELLDKYSVKSYPRATAKGGDIDELAALISTLDYVVTACTTVVYIAGALGIPCYVLVPSEPSYRYHLSGDFPWYKSVKLVRQKRGQKWADVAQKLQDNYLRGLKCCA